MGYCGTPDIKTMNEETQFIEITGAVSVKAILMM